MVLKLCSFSETHVSTFTIHVVLLHFSATMRLFYQVMKLHIFQHYVHSRVENMRTYLKKFMMTHKYFVEAVAGFLIQ